MSFLAPFFLIGLGALLVPIIIHMWSKDAKQSVAFGSLRFLRETETRTTRSIMPSQWLLLLVRLLLITTLVFLLAEMLYSSKNEKSRLYLVDQVYQDSELLSNLLDTISEESEASWLANGFPGIDQPVPKSTSNYWELLRNTPANASCVVVISPLYQRHFTGKRIPISPVCQWIKPPVEPSQSELTKIEKDGNAFSLSANYDEWITSIDFANAENGTPLELRYHLRVDESYQKLGDIFEAALASIQRISKVSLKESQDASQADWIIWLSDEAAPAVPIIQTDSEVLNWTKTGDKAYLVSSNMTMEDAIKMELPRLVLTAFMEDLFLENESDLLTVDTEMFEYQDSLEVKATREDASPYLWTILLALLLLERWMSFKENAMNV